eukprot:TRINITY_DN56709_c0_g1_i1.p1 TRINITY_DN56709_c0_g1~~TRINITY_DN56709_c0_g1_i1.p1  ORF type:complete len:371 (+),score=31.48 TRINITY_DN56709_c0_g1_i1:59-1114(+)
MADVNQSVVVVGGGVMGFTSALRALQAGFKDVSIVAQSFSPIPSKSSPAVYRPAWMGKTPPEVTIRWGSDSANEFSRLARHGSETGITTTTHVEFYKAEAGPSAAIPDPALAKVMSGFRDATQLEIDTYCPAAAGGWVYSTFMVEGMRFLSYLAAEGKKLDLRVIQQEVKGDAQSEEWCKNAISIAERPSCRIVVNATGLAGGPECYPIRGDLVLVRAPYVKVAVGEYNPLDKTRPTYVYPRRDHVVLGSYYLEGDGDRDERPENTADVINRCAEFIPELRSAPLIGVVPCIRPGRKDGVRLDRIQVDGFHVINNYGHGGGGMSISWGCAGDVVRHIQAAATELSSARSRL